MDDGTGSRNSLNEAGIIQAVLGGDVDAYARLVEAYQEPAIRVALGWLGQYEDACDAAQEAFVRAYQALGRFRRQARFSTWLYRIVVNVCRDAQRRRGSRPEIAAMIGEPDAQEPDGRPVVEVADARANARHAAANRELAMRISQGIGTLPVKQRTAFVLHHLEGLSLDDVASVMRCRVGTVKSHVFRATERLRVTLGPWTEQEG